MRKFTGLPALVAARDAVDGRVDLQARVIRQLLAGDPHVLLDAAFLVMDREVDPRAMWEGWLDTETLRVVPWTSGTPAEVVDAWWRPHSGVADLFDGNFGDDEVPSTPRVPDFEHDRDRVRWWALAVLIAAWESRGAAREVDLVPASRIELAACEHRIGTPLPQDLRDYHLALGTSETVEEILAVDAPGAEASIEPLLDAYPGIPDLLEMSEVDTEETLAQMKRLVAFSAYLGNGNYWCFEQGTGAVWYFDHDGPTPLTRMFDSVGEYFDALTVLAIGRAREALVGEDTSEHILTGMLGADRVRTWMY